MGPSMGPSLGRAALRNQAAAQVMASLHVVLGEAGLVGGSLPFTARQPRRSSCRVAARTAGPLKAPNFVPYP